MEDVTVSRAKKLAQVTSSVLFCFLTAGVVFGEFIRCPPRSVTEQVHADVSSLGYAALKPVLIDNQVYGFLCEDGKGYCKASDIRMNFMFTLATVVTNVSPASQ